MMVSNSHTSTQIDVEDDDEMLMKRLQQVQSPHTLKHTNLTMICLPPFRVQKWSYSLVLHYYTVKDRLDMPCLLATLSASCSVS